MSEPLEGGEAIRLALTTCPDEGTARAIARALVEERLAACGNVIPGLTSIYRWKGAIEETGECLLLLKVRTEDLAALAGRLRALHPYEVPELLVVEIERGAPDYLRWVVEETQSRA